MFQYRQMLVRLRAGDSEYHIAVVSPRLVQWAQELGSDVFKGALIVNDLAALGPTNAQNALNTASKYELPVNLKFIGLFRTFVMSRRQFL